MRLAATLLIVGMAGCVTGLGVGIPLEYTATVNSTLYLRAQLDDPALSELDDTARVLAALAETDKYVQARYPDLAGSYLELVGGAGGFQFSSEIDEVIEMVRLLDVE